MRERMPSDIEELHAFIDGELRARDRRRVEERLAADPEARREAEDYAAIGAGLKELFEPVLHEPIPRRLRRRPLRWQRPLAAVAASLVLLVAGAWIGMGLEGRVPLAVAGAPHLVREAAMAYAVFTPEVRHPVEVSGKQEAHLVAWLTKRLGAQVKAPRLEGLGFLLVGGRLLSSDDGPGALFMYENADGQRVVLYVCRNETAGRQTAFRFASDEGVSVFYWYDGPFSYGLAGELDRDDLLALAESVYRQIAI